MEDQGACPKEVILKQTLSGNHIPTTANVLPQYLHLPRISAETTTRPINSTTSDNAFSLPSNGLIDVSMVSSEGDAFLCNKLYLVR